MLPQCVMESSREAMVPTRTSATPPINKAPTHKRRNQHTHKQTQPTQTPDGGGHRLPSWLTKWWREQSPKYGDTPSTGTPLVSSSSSATRGMLASARRGTSGAGRKKQAATPPGLPAAPATSAQQQMGDKDSVSQTAQCGNGMSYVNGTHVIILTHRLVPMFSPNKKWGTRIPFVGPFRREMAVIFKWNT